MYNKGYRSMYTVNRTITFVVSLFYYHSTKSLQKQEVLICNQFAKNPGPWDDDVKNPSMWTNPCLLGVLPHNIVVVVVGVVVGCRTGGHIDEAGRAGQTGSDPGASSGALPSRWRFSKPRSGHCKKIAL